MKSPDPGVLIGLLGSVLEVCIFEVPSSNLLYSTSGTSSASPVALLHATFGGGPRGGGGGGGVVVSCAALDLSESSLSSVSVPVSVSHGGDDTVPWSPVPVPCTFKLLSQLTLPLV